MNKRGKTIAMLVGLSAIVIIGAILLYYSPSWIANLRIGSVENHPNYAGTLEIPSVNISLPCLDANNADLAKDAVDAPNCGARIYYPYPHAVGGTEDPETYMIVDHDYQGFKEIRKCVPQDMAFFHHKGGETTQYKVVCAFEGYISKDNELLDDKGQSFWKCVPQNLLLVTCNPSANVDAPISSRRLFVYLEPVS